VGAHTRGSLLRIHHIPLANKTPIESTLDNNSFKKSSGEILLSKLFLALHTFFLSTVSRDANYKGQEEERKHDV
jgi:hypothetical protein